MTSEDFLAAMAGSSRQRSLAAQALLPTSELVARIRDLESAPSLTLSTQGFDLIAELKLRSPAVGALRSVQQDDLEGRVLRYVDAGAAAVSVLTEPSRFDGELSHLERSTRVLRSVGVPAMRKDFLVDDYQVLEARAAGAGGVLLIIRMLSRETLSKMLDAILEQGLFVLLEAFDESDVEIAVRLIESRLGQRSLSPSGSRVLLGVNCRDLVTLQVIPGRLESIVSKLPQWLPRVAESGLKTAADAERLAAAGYDVALVGSALMSGDHPRELAAQMLDAGRSAKARRTR